MAYPPAGESGILQMVRKALLRSIDELSVLAEDNHSEDLRASLEALTEKLKKNRFNLAVLGQTKRGKSSFINALLGARILPTGVLPLTSVITRVTYGENPSAKIFYETGESEQIAVECLYEYITEAGNPGNKKQVASAEVAYPSQFLSMGVDLIDTPGIGSTRRHNTSTTEGYLAEVDAGIAVLSVDPAITAVESDFFRRLRQDVPKLLFVVNKTDIATPEEVEEVVWFLENELRNHVGVKKPEVFALSARQVIKEMLKEAPLAPNGMDRLMGRLRHFAVEEKEQALFQSVAIDLLRIAGTLRFVAMVGERARLMHSEEMASRQSALEEAVTRSDQELKDLRHLLREDTATLIVRIENDLKEHIATTAPRVHNRLNKLRNQQPSKNRKQLSALLDRFMLDEVEAVFEDWRAQEDERIHMELAALTRRFVDRTNIVLERLENAAGDLFDVPVAPVAIASSLTVESRLRYSTDPLFQHWHDKLIFALPKSLMHRLVFGRMLSRIDAELSRNADRIREDYLERLEKSVATFETELTAAVAIVADNLRFVAEPQAKDAKHSRRAIPQLSPIVTQCAALG
ncbi:MAG TPA: dynamin family protein [Terracidiphilus sp.]|nr:dynamin family protein [Terracidiphilus sp.]